jgi:phytoene synthase
VTAAEPTATSASIASAYAACERLAREHYENFPVASRLLPRAVRPHVAAVYAFARIADDFADEGERPAEERQHLLDEWGERLRRCVANGQTDGKAEALPCRGETASRTEALPCRRREGDDGDEFAPLFRALGHTIRQCRLPVGLFEDLLSAFRQDTTRRRYDTWADVLDYCRRSANPVGRLVLRIAGHDDERLDRASDAVCTALQLANFWQDLERDWRRGRLYVPLDEMRAAGAAEADLDSGALTAAWRNLLASLVHRTRDLFLGGREVADLVGGTLRLELRLTWLGGWRILERLEQQRFDVFGRRPALGARDMPLILWRAATWRRWRQR